MCRTSATSVFSLFDFGWVEAWVWDFPWYFALRAILVCSTVVWGVVIYVSNELRCWEGLKSLAGRVVPRASSDGRPFSFANNFHVNGTIDIARVGEHAHGHPYLAERRAVLRQNVATALARCEGHSTTGKTLNLNLFGGPRNFREGPPGGTWEHYQVKSAYNTRDLHGATKFDDYDSVINTAYSRGGVDRVFMWDAAWFLNAEQMAKVLARREFVVFNMRRADSEVVHNPFNMRIESTLRVDGQYVTERVVGGDVYHHPHVVMPTRDKFSASYNLHGVRRVYQFQKVKVNLTLREGDTVKPDPTIYEDVWAAAEVNHVVADFRLEHIFPNTITNSGISLGIDENGILTHATRRRATNQGYVVNRMSDKLFRSVQQAVASSSWGLYFENSIRMRAPSLIDNEDYSVEEIVELALQLRAYNEVGRSGKVEGLWPVAKAWVWRKVALWWYRMYYRQEPSVITFRARTNWATSSMGTGRVSQAAGDCGNDASGNSTSVDSADGGGPRRSACSGCDPQPPPPAQTRAPAVRFAEDGGSKTVRTVRPPAHGADARQRSTGHAGRPWPPPPAARGRGRPTQSVAAHTVCSLPHKPSMAGSQAARSSPDVGASTGGRTDARLPADAPVIGLGPGAVSVSAGMGLV